MNTHHTPTRPRDLRELTKRRYPAEVQAAMNRFRRKFGGVLDDLRETLAERVVEAGPTEPEQIITLSIREHRGKIVTALKNGGREGVTSGRRMASRRFGLDIDFSQEPVSAINAVESTVDRYADDTLGYMAEQFESDLKGWLDEGLGVDEIADRIESEGYAETLANRHSETYARTLVQGAAERGNHDAMREAPGVIGERWNGTMDGRIRDSHAEADGQIVPVNSSFILVNENGASRLDHPGDPAGPVEEIANCRCYATPVFEDDLDDEDLAALRSGQRLNV